MLPCAIAHGKTNSSCLDSFLPGTAPIAARHRTPRVPFRLTGHALVASLTRVAQ